MKNNLNETWLVRKKSWYVAFTKPRSEETAQFHLQAKGIEVFYPKLFLPVPNRSRRQTVSLFPNYLFVRIDASSPDYFQVTWCRGVKRLVSFGDTPSVVEDCHVDFLRKQADPRGLITAKSKLKVGDEVQITDGSFKGLVGIIHETPDHKSRIQVLMSILNRNVRVHVPTSYINVGWVASVANCVG